MSPEPGRGRHLGAKAPPEGLVDGGLGAVAPAHEEAVGAPEPHEVCKAKKREGPEGDGPHKGRMGLCRDVHHCSIPWTVSLCLCLYQGSLLLCAHLGLYCWYPSSQPHNQTREDSIQPRGAFDWSEVNQIRSVGAETSIVPFSTPTHG